MGNNARLRQLAIAAVLFFVVPPAAGAADVKPGVLSGGTFTPQVPPAAQFGPESGRECARSAILSDLERTAADSARKNQLAVAEKDPQLCAVATTFLGWKEQGAVPASVAGPVAQYLGVAARPEVQVASFDSGAADDVVPALLQTLGNFMANASQPRFGLAVEKTRARGTSGGRSAEERKETARVVLVLLDSAVSFQPFPRKLELGAGATVAGELRGDWTSVKVLVSDELGKLGTPEQPPGKAFKAEVKCEDKPGGRVTLEVRGESAAGTRTLSTVAIQCGGELPTSFPTARAAWPRDLPAQERKMEEAVNAERAVVGLPPLEADQALAGVARKVAEELREAVAAGRAPQADTGGLLQEAGLASPVLLQNPGEAVSAEEAQARFALSPSTRQSILSTEVNHMGVGVASSKDAMGRNTVLVVQLFTRVLAPVDVAQAKQDFYAAVQKKREEAKAPAATVDPAIDRIMQKYAESMASAGGKLPSDMADEITHPLRAPYKAINMIEGAKGSIEDFLKESTVTWDGNAMGVGIAQGTHPVLGKNALFVAFVVATPRGAEGAKATPAAAKPRPKSGGAKPKTK